MAQLEQMPEGVLLVDSEWRVIGYNQGAERQLSYSGEKLRALYI